MSKRKNPHRITIKKTSVWGKRRHKLTCNCGFFQYTSKGECQRLGKEHLDRKEAAGEKVIR